MSQYLHDDDTDDYDEDIDDANAVAMPRVFSENSRAKNRNYLLNDKARLYSFTENVGRQTECPIYTSFQLEIVIGGTIAVVLIIEAIVAIICCGIRKRRYTYLSILPNPNPLPQPKHLPSTPSRRATPQRRKISNTIAF